MFWDSRLKLDLLLSCVNQQKCDKLTGSGFVESCNIVYPRPALCTTHCARKLKVHSGLCTGAPTQWAQYKLWVLPGTYWDPLDSWKEISRYYRTLIHQFCLLQYTLRINLFLLWKNSASHECIHVTNWTHPCDIRKTDQMEQKFNSENQCSDLYDKSCCPLNYHFPLQNAFVNHKPPFNWFQWI